MVSIPTKTSSFPAGNRWGISNATRDIEFSVNRLIHAAVTAGHGPEWRHSIASETGAQFELLWKTSALRAAVCQKIISRRSWQSPINRLIPTERYGRMDPSERRALSYHLGITFGVAWARKALRIPWLLHLDVYRENFDVNLQPGDSRPDLIGRHPDGSWSVFEAKGRKTSPSTVDEEKAKKQSQRIVKIGCDTPTGCFAFFSFFAPDRHALGRAKPQILQMRVIDPNPGASSEPITLPLLTDDTFFRLYYEPWRKLLVNDNFTSVEGRFTWRKLIDLDFRVGMLTEVATALEMQKYKDLPQIIEYNTGEFGLSNRFPDWAGDGLVIEPGESWKTMLSSE